MQQTHGTALPSTFERTLTILATTLAATYYLVNLLSMAARYFR